MGHTTKTAFASTSDWIQSSAMTQVFSGTVTFPSSQGWMEITLNTAFNYNNTQNLVIAVDENAAGYATNNGRFVAAQTTSNTCIYYYDDSTNPNPVSPPAAVGTAAYKNYLQLEITTPAGPMFSISPNETSHGFGDVLIGDYITQEYVISNAGSGGSVDITTPLAVTGDSYFSIVRQPLNTSLAAGDTTSFVVKYSPTTLGSHSGSLTITYGLAKATHTISFSGRGVTTPVTMFEEDWESGSDGWTFVNGTQTNKWHLGTATYSSASHSMYISNNSGASNAYTLTAASVVHVYRDIAFTAGVDGFDFEFDFKGYGEASFSDAMDVYLLPTSVTPIAGTDLFGSYQDYYLFSTYLQSNWVSVGDVLDSSYAGGTWRLCFQWYNDSSAGTQPPRPSITLRYRISLLVR